MQSRIFQAAGTMILVLLPVGTITALRTADAHPVAIAAAPVRVPESSTGVISDHVMLISIDGLRPDAIEKYDATVLQRLMREGAVAEEARTVLPSTTLPSHTSMLTGVPPEVHRVTWNDDRPERYGAVSVPTIFSLAKAGGYTTAAFISKSKLRHLFRPGSLDHAAVLGRTTLLSLRSIRIATRYIRSRRPNLVFVHIAHPDYSGHNSGWMTAAYGWSVRRADGAVGELLEAADDAYGAGSYSVIVTSDHGGHDRGHGTARAEDMQIPWIAWGAGVKPGTVRGLVHTTDTAATVLWLLGVDRPETWSGKAVATAFSPAPARGVSVPSPIVQ